MDSKERGLTSWCWFVTGKVINISCSSFKGLCKCVTLAYQCHERADPFKHVAAVDRRHNTVWMLYDAKKRTSLWLAVMQRIWHRLWFWEHSMIILTSTFSSVLLWLSKPTPCFSMWHGLPRLEDPGSDLCCAVIHTWHMDGRCALFIIVILVSFVRSSSGWW